jgi:flagellar assembly protein FliH
MGKVVKSARFVDEKYVVGVPAVNSVVAEVAAIVDDAFAAEFAAVSGNGNGNGNGHANGAYDLEPEAHVPEPVPQVDWEALRADAEAIVDRAAADAESLLKQAETTALELVERAQAHAAGIEEEARRKGHADGYAEGHQKGIAEFEPVVRTLREWIDSLHAQRDEYVTAAEPELVRLAMTIAERIVHTEVANNRQVVVENVRAALTRLVSREVVTLRVHPTDHETIRQYRDSIVAASDVEHLRIVEDQRVDRGGVLVETDAGTIDAKIATQLREAKRAILTDDALALDSNDEHETL